MRKLRIFLSSRFGENDFLQLRKKLSVAIDKKLDFIGIEVVQLEKDNDPRSPFGASIEEAQESDLFIHILGESYGTPPEGKTKSYTHLEYEAAKEAKIPIIPLPIGDVYCRDPIEFSENENFRQWQEDVLYSKTNIVNIKFPTNYDTSKIIKQVLSDIGKIFNIKFRKNGKTEDQGSPFERNKEYSVQDNIREWEDYFSSQKNSLTVDLCEKISCASIKQHLATEEKWRDMFIDKVNDDWYLSQQDIYSLEEFPVTVEEFRDFVDSTKYKTIAEKDKGCSIYKSTEIKLRKKAFWGSPGLKQTSGDPVVCVSYKDAVEYANWKTNNSGDYFYCLPIRKEWEKFAGSVDDNIVDCAWHDENSESTTHPMGDNENRLKLHDMFGNVREICTGGNKGKIFALGGSWYDTSYKIKESKAIAIETSYRANTVGFRLMKIKFKED